ncbi:MAG: TlpA family protein disulfide reductase [Candidatus Rokubacteria bacterium]|nr:TlpA family protein disulfide reductase [Candidatus Rokubacteria bacterium]
MKVVPILIAGLLALALAGGAVFALSGGVPVPAPQGALASESKGGPAGSMAAPTASPPRAARTGPVLRLDDAIRELDLIRPSREKFADDFTLALADGTRFRLSEHRGKAVLVNFWATWCPPCREEMPAMERLYRQHKDRGLVLVAVSVDADPAVVTPYLRENKLSFPVALDPKMDVADTYGVRALPSSFVVDREGRVTVLALGPRRWDNDAAHSLVEALTH